MWEDNDLPSLCQEFAKSIANCHPGSAVARQLREILSCPDVLLLELGVEGRWHYLDTTLELSGREFTLDQVPGYWRAAFETLVTQVCNTAHGVPLAAKELRRGLIVPLHVDNKLYGAVCLANELTAYGEQQRHALRWFGMLGGWAMRERQQVNRRIEHGDLQHLRSDFLAIIDGTDAVIYSKRLDGRYEFINHKFEQIFSLQRSEVIGRTDMEVFAASPELARRFIENDQMVARLGRSVQFEETAPHTEGLHQYVSVKFPLFNELGQIHGVAGISTDITQRVQAEHTIQFLKDRNDDILMAVADGVVLLNQTGFIGYMNPAAKKMLGLTSYQIKTNRFLELVMAIDANGTPRNELSLPIYQALYQQAPTVDEEDVFWCGSGEMLNVEYSAIPMRNNELSEGAVVTFRDIRLRLERRRDRRELKAAQAMQRLLYPQTHPRLPGFDIAGAVFPAQGVCGDYYDFILRDEHRLALIVADACGHDLAAALLMVNARANFRSCLKSGDNLNSILVKVNDILANELQVGQFITTFLLELDDRDQTLTYAGAGQAAVLLRNDGTVTSLKSAGLMLGLQNNLTLKGEIRELLSTGDIVLICTDGLAETLSTTGALLTTQRIVERVQRHRQGTAHDIINDLVKLAHEHSAGRWPQDDATLLVVKVLDLGATH